MWDAAIVAAVIAGVSTALASVYVLVFERADAEIGRVLRIAGQLALAVWFAYWSWQTIGSYFEQFPLHMDMIGFDGRIYQHAAGTWLAGGIHGLPTSTDMPGVMAGTCASSSAVRRRLSSPSRP